MAKTNSNSITSIFTVALNEDLDFKRKVITIFEERLFPKGSERHIDPRVEFYDCTHTPLLYKEMKGKEIDIIARIPGIHKPVLMIEIKANTREPLQKSQKKEGAYHKTAKNHHISLIYIIPENYEHKKEIPPIAKIITWETIQERARNMKVTFDTQISNFVDVSETNKEIDSNEKKLFSNIEQLLLIKKISKLVLDKVEVILDKYKRKKNRGSQEDQWGIGHYYDYKGSCYYFGINPPLAKVENGKYFLSLAIAEDCKTNAVLEPKNNHMYFEDGYYYVSILQDDFSAGDEKVLSDIRKELKDLLINDEIRLCFETFYLLRSKLGEEKFDSIFEEKPDSNDYEYIINEKIHAKLAKIVNN